MAIQGFNHYRKADKFEVDRTVEEASASDCDALALPGGVGNPETLRMDENAVRFVKEFFEQGKPVGAICHAPWMLIEEFAEERHEQQREATVRAGTTGS